MSGIFWLASYPKSGNTWFRIFLRNLLTEGEGTEDGLDDIGFPIASNRISFDEFTGIDSTDLLPEEIENLRPVVYEQLVATAPELPLYMKIHDAYTFLPNGEPIVSKKATAGAVYFIRNPLDVAVSYSHFKGTDDFTKTIAKMNSVKYSLCHHDGDFSAQLRQKILGWSGHVQSWKNAPIPKHFLRYEDMQAAPLETFSGAVKFLGLPHTEQEIQRALEASSFDRLQKLEQEKGFRERPQKCTQFFRSGKSGGWRDSLNQEQVDAIIEAHADVMKQFGYLSEEMTVLPAA